MHTYTASLFYLTNIVCHFPPLYTAFLFHLTKYPWSLPAATPFAYDLSAAYAK